MIRILAMAAALTVALCFSASAEEAAMVNPGESSAADMRGGGAVMTLSLSHGVPFRVFTLDAPPRLVVDFRGLNTEAIPAETMVQQSAAISGLRSGVFRPGWSRLVADLDAPLLPAETGMRIDDSSGKAVLSLVLEPVSPGAFAEASGIPATALWAQEPVVPPRKRTDDDLMVVAIDPGHGGIDPGAEREGLSEKVLMLDMARELKAALEATGLVHAVLTRQSDVFVSLQARVALAQQVEADAFVSLHADALADGGAQGATVYTLSEEASDKATALLAARHNRADILAGVDLTGADDVVAGVLLDIARRETAPRTAALARSLVTGMDEAGGPMNRHPLRKAGFSVLKLADVPSVLVEVGFLSSQRDLDNLRRSEWRSQMVAGLVSGLLAWHMEDEARRTLLRQ
ncbi:N-acetylmuramoyl-L-alanine amidase [Roseobacter sp. S98]|uniref:N-acetylmuramoyl-L-alanine amidase n=1 Tax=Roseobacter algicola (ex Choi et al. 2025) (nom. illeg.) TaxID=3092138 RepID=UPI0035C6985E